MMTMMDFARGIADALPSIFIAVWAYYHIARLERRIDDNESQINHLQSALQATVKALNLLAGGWEDDGTEDVEEKPECTQEPQR